MSEYESQLETLLEQAIFSIGAAAMSAAESNYGKALYEVDYAEITLMQIRNVLVSIIHNSEVDG